MLTMPKELINLETAAKLSMTYVLVKSRRVANFPPGPTCRPLLGNLDVIRHNQRFHLTVHAFTQKYGGVVGMQFWSYPVVFISDLEVLKETLLHQANNFSDRPTDNPFINLVFNKKGIIFQNGHVWRKLRKMTLCTLHDMATHHTSMQDIVETEIQALLGHIEQAKNHVFYSNFFNKVIANIMCNVLFGIRYEYNSEELNQLLEDFGTIFVNAGFQNIFHFMPVMTFPLMPLIQPESITIIKASVRIGRIMSRLIKEHRENFNPNCIRDFVDVFLKEELAEKVHNANSGVFCDGQIFQVVIDLFATGSESGSTALQWAMLLLIKNPEVQEKCRKHIQKVCGINRRPSMRDRSRLPYVEATIAEVQRLGNTAALSPLRQNPKEVHIKGFTIPAKSIIVQNLYSLHMSPKYWKDPDEFMPERFLNEEGRFFRPEAFYPFGVGRRSCVGDNLAKMELFLSVTSLLQRYRLEAVYPESLPGMLDPKFGLALTPPPFCIHAIEVDS